MRTTAQRLTQACWFSKLPDAGPCEGPTIIRAHLIPKQLMRREHPHGHNGRSVAVLHADPRGWRWACGGTLGLAGHHGALDSYKLSIPRSMIPPETEAFAEELDLLWWIDKRYGPIRALA